MFEQIYVGSIINVILIGNNLIRIAKLNFDIYSIVLKIK